MRIATVGFSATLGGLELGSLRAAAAMRERGHEAIAVLPEAPELRAHAERIGIRVTTITPRLRYLDIVAARALRRLFHREAIDLVLVARTHDLSTAMLGAGRQRAVVLYQQMQSGVNKRDWFHNRVYARLDGCIAITEQGRRQMLRHTVLDADRIDVIPPGLDTERFRPGDGAQARALFGVPEDAFVVGMVGGFNPGKGQREFIEALGIASAAEPALADAMHAIVVGRRSGDSPEYIAELERLRAGLPRPERVGLHPFADDPALAFRALDVFVLASYSETFGIVVQEAMSSGVPVIATDAGGVPEIVQHGANGLLAPPHDARALADAILELWRNPELRTTLAAQARADAVERYDLTRQMNRFEGALERALVSRRARAM